MNKIINASNNNIYEEYTFTKEIEEYEPLVVKYSSTIFGEDGIYFDLKKKIGKNSINATIPDGYYLDLSFKKTPKLYIVEIELTSHDLYNHIGAQLLRFAGASEYDKIKLKNMLLDEISRNDNYREKIDKYLNESDINNVNELLEKVTIDDKPSAIVIIDEITDDLNLLVKSINMSIEAIEVKAFKYKGDLLIEYTPFNNDIKESVSPKTSIEDLDTIVVAAREDGFNEVFIKEKCWYQISISPNMLDKIKYFAIYQTNPTSAITYVAEIKSIERYKDSKKYILYFNIPTIKKIRPIPLGKKKYLSVRGRKYTSYRALLQAHTLDDIWE